MAGDKVVQTTGLMGWIDRRFPLTKMFKEHMSEYYAPKNFNFWYFFGSLAMLVLVIQILTGIFMVMHYKPDAKLAFLSVEYIMREVPYGWIIRYMHSTGASMFFVVVYLHMLRGLFYGSYRKPRELVWIFGVCIFLCLMAEAFFGYLLPWGQMSYWGAQVIVNLFSAIPFVGDGLSTWIRGDFVVSDATLNRFFAFHVIAIPLVLIGLVVAHIIALHEVGSNNPDGIEIKANKDRNGRPLDGIPFHPYYSVHDILGVAGFLLVFAAIMFFAPTMGGYFLEANNFLPADPYKTPPHIAPVWYFTAFYSMLRATTDEFTWALIAFALFFAVYILLNKNIKGLWRILWPVVLVLVAVGLRTFDAKFWGVVVMGGTVVILGFLPWLDKSPVKSIRYRPTWHKFLYAIFIVDFIVLCIIGTKAPSPLLNIVSQVGTVIYLAFFFFMPVWSRLGKFKQVPDRVTFKQH
ncbi:cytochrome b [Brackiella oedipodis]|uniref:cytochrome b n=1 Tax=Brackiella oedipodis TaxID=124225 RepID=UPI0004904A53|nr:cytochrome bc complex cytochrome b subunit [Brackiella oedipodis]